MLFHFPIHFFLILKAMIALETETKDFTITEFITWFYHHMVYHDAYCTFSAV